jgi:Uma2 family endonuclease
VREAAAAYLREPPDPDQVDHCISMDGVDWDQYAALVQARGESDRPRLAFLEGTLSIMTPSRDHDRISRTFTLLLAVFAEERGLDLNAAGSWTIQKKPERGAEPDECFVLGQRPDAEVPDLAIEVLWTAQLGTKLEIYRGLGVPEVWTWEQGVITVHVLRDQRYERSPHSLLLPDLDLALLARLVTRTDQIAAIRELRASLRRP